LKIARLHNVLNSLYRQIASYLSPASERGLLSILIYHRVLASPDALFPHEVTQTTFDMQMVHLKAVFNVLPLSEAVERLKCGTLPARAACITFDDGYADNATIALPILQRHGLKATFFIATAYLDGGCMFNDRVIAAIRHYPGDKLDLTRLDLGSYDMATYKARADAINQILSKVKCLPVAVREAKVSSLCEITQYGPVVEGLMMSSEQIRQLSLAGMEIGAHTAHHPMLAQLDDAAVRQEIQLGKRFLESLLGESIKVFAYPNGRPGIDYLPQQVNIVRELGLVAAVSTRCGVASKQTDLFQLPRFTPWQSNISCFIPELLRNLRKRC
jgi:peptidoglycan/xylan/chitin deacetylase (PgdA/CDA1 family)